MTARALLMPLGLAILATAVSSGTLQPAMSSPPGARVLVVTQVPPATPPAGIATRHRLEERYPVGSRIVIASLSGAAPAIQVITEDLVAAGSPAISHDGRTLAFTGRRSHASRWAIHAVASSGGAPRRLGPIDRDCADPAWLPDGRLVFACRDPGASSGPPAAACEASPGWSLFVGRPGGPPPERLTFVPGAATDPTVLRDGRILFSLTAGASVGDPACEGALFTIHPDGTHIETFDDAHDARPRMRPRETASHGIVFLAPGATGSDAMHLDPVHPTTRPAPLVPDHGGVPIRDVTSVEPTPDGSLLIAARSGATGSSGTLGIHDLRDGVLHPLFDSPEWHDTEALEPGLVPRPRAIPAVVEEGGDRGTLIGYDTARTDGTIGPPRDGARPVTLVVQSLRAVPVSSPMGAPAREGQPGSRISDLFTIRLEEDGSFMTDLPSDRAVRVRTLDARGETLATSAWFQIRPGEVRACFGCHEPRHLAPVNRAVLALRSPLPQDALPGGSR